MSRFSNPIRLAAGIALVLAIVLAAARAALNELDGSTSPAKAGKEHIVTVPTRVTCNGQGLIDLLAVIACSVNSSVST